jgi:hypothetical protein
MNKNDVVIKELLAKVEKQRAELGPRPRTSLITNGVVDCGFEKGLNINTMTKSQIVSAYANMIQNHDNIQRACKDLGVKLAPSSCYTISQWKEDFVMRLSLIEWNEKKSNLDKTEAQLKALVSEEARTADILDSISNMLG